MHKVMPQPAMKCLKQPPPPPFRILYKLIFVTSLALAVAGTSLTPTRASPVSASLASSQSLTTPVVALSSTGCTDGSFVDLTANPRVVGTNNDLVEDCQALVAVQNHWAAVQSNGSLASDKFLKTWGTGTNKKINTWQNVSLKNNRVDSIYLSYSRVEGSIPAELGNLTALTSLRFNSHNLSGNIPKEIWNLSNLTILELDSDLFNFARGLTGDIPTQIGNLTNLTTLTLAGNNLSGNIPTQIGNLTNLTTLTLAGNNLSGNIPTQIGNLTNLTNLFLSNNRLGGNIPTQIGQLTNLTTLDLTRNRLTGNIPTQIGQLTNLTTLDLSYNGLAGNIPTELGSLTNLAGSSTKGLNLSHNILSGNIPSELGNLTKIATIDLSYNLLTGNIPTEFDQLIQLRNLRLNNNQLSGNIPTQLNRLASSGSGVLSAFLICDNSISGGVPTDLRTGIRLGTRQYDPIGCQATSNIVYTNPTGLVINSGKSITIDASRYVKDGIYAISCRNATGKHASISSITRSGCSYTITAGSTVAAAATFTVPYTSAGGDTHNGEVSVAITSTSGVSNIRFTAPSPNPTVAAGQSTVINASTYASDGSYTITCGDATNQHTRISSISRSPHSCLFTVTAGTTTGTATFTVPYTSSGGNTHNGIIAISIGVASNIVFTPPEVLSIAINRNIIIDASSYVADGSYSISCGEVVRVFNVYRHLLQISQNGCSYTLLHRIQGTTAIAVPYMSTGGDTHLGIIFVDLGAISEITFTAPKRLLVATNRSIDIDAHSYITESQGYTVSCLDATNTHALISTITRDGCTYTITPGSQTGTATFTVPYTSTGGDTENGTVTITIGPDSNISFTAPTGLQVGKNRNRTINALDYATENSAYTISCSDAKNVGSKITIQRSGCNYTISPTGTEGTSSFTIPYTSTGGDTEDGTVTITIGPASNISFATPSGLQVSKNRSLTINALDYVTENSAYTISCSDAKNVGSKITIQRSGCNYTISPTGTEGTSSFTIPYTSTGGDTYDGVVSITVGPNFIPFRHGTRSLNPSVLTGRSIILDTTAFTPAGSNIVSCGDATDVDAKITVRRSGCSFMVTAGSFTGTASFTVPYISTGGQALDITISVNIYSPPSVLYFREPFSDFELGTNRTLVIDALGYASDGNYSISCGDATGVDSKITVMRANPSSEPCKFTITPTGTQGEASFTVPYSSSGGTTLNGVFTVEIGPASTISFTSPTGLKLGTNRTLTINAASYATDGDYPIECSNATSVDTKITITRPNSDSCGFNIVPTGTHGTATFTVPYRSIGGATLDGVINIEIGAASTIVYTPPTGLSMTASSTITINAASYVTDGSYTITCGQATNRDTKITRATNTGCSYQITVGADTGTATFTVPYRSAGGHTLNAQVSITITELPRNTAPALDRQDMICSMAGMEPVRNSTADQITQSDIQVAFCQQNGEIYCYKGANRAHIGTLLINIFGWDNCIKDCYQAIK